MKLRSLFLFFVLAMALTLSSCEVIGDIFKGGIIVGILIVVLVIGLIIWIIRKVF